METKSVRYGAVAVLVLCVSTLVRADETARTPEQLIKSLIEAARRGDVEGFLGGLTVDSRKALTESVAGQATLRQAGEEFQKALDERFGKGTKTLAAAPEDLKAALGHLVAAEVVSQKKRPDGSVELQVKTSVKDDGGRVVSHEDSLVAREEGGSWKLALGFAADGKVVAQMKAAAEQITQEVLKGTYKDRLSAMVALANAWARKEHAQ
jgi:hypothetical protein